MSPVSNAFASVGCKFKRGDGTSNEAFTAVAEVNAITGPGMSRATIDVTTLDSTGGYKEFIGSFRDGGEVTLDMNFTRDSWDEFKEDFERSASWNYQIAFSDGVNGAENTLFDFAGWVTGLSINIALEDKVTSTVTIKVDGSLTVTS